MPGFNHYPDCSCGWCVNYGRAFRRTAPDRESFSPVFRYRDAEHLLRSKKAGKGLAACFVIPNARCPLCNEPVFYYQNEYGSRVFFDDLGPPWPKHGCTDNRKVLSQHRDKHTIKITRRPRGEMMELIAAAKTVGRYGNRILGNSDGPSEWTLLLILELERSGWENTVRCQYLESPQDEFARFSFTSAIDDRCCVGDLISMRGREISIFLVDKMKSKKYKIRMLEQEE